MKRTPMPPRRTPLRVHKPLPRAVKPLPAVSRKRAAQQRVYSKLRAAFLAEHPRCQWPGGCAWPATTVQHLRGRSGERLNDTTWWAASCWPHNAWAEEHTGAALEMGWLVRIEGAA